MLLGDAFTAVADDEYTLFYNPAALGFHKGIGITVTNVDTSLPNITNAKYLKIISDPKNAFPTKADGSVDMASTSTKFMGLPISTHLGLTPTAKMQNWGISFFLNHSTVFNLKNATNPTWNIELVYDRGMVLGGAFDFNLFGAKNALGLSVKAMNRRGFIGNFYLLGGTLATKILGEKANAAY